MLINSASLVRDFINTYKLIRLFFKNDKNLVILFLLTFLPKLV